MTPTTPRDPTVRFGVFELDRRAGEIRKAGVRLSLQPQPLRVLSMLVDRAGELVTRDELRKQLWPDDTFVDFERGLNAAVNRLRDTLGDSADTPRFIETLPRRGYRFIAPIQPSEAVGDVRPAPTAARPRKAFWRTVGLLVFLGALAFIVALTREPWNGAALPAAPAAGILRSYIDIPAGIQVLLPVSPDGRYLALYQMSGPGGRTLLVQPLDGSDARWLPGTEFARPIAWSPDGASFAVLSRGVLKIVRVTGDVVRTVAAVPDDEGWYPGASAAWSSDGVILLGGSRLRRVSLADGRVADVFSVAGPVARQDWPCFLPDGRQFVFAQDSADPEHRGVFLGSLDSARVTRLLRDPANAVVSPLGFLLYGRDGTLYAQRFRTEHGVLSGKPWAIVSGGVTQGTYTQFAVGPHGTLLWGRADAGPASRPAWFDRHGRPLGPVGEPGAYYQIALAPDGRHVVVDEGDGLSMFDASHGVRTRLNPADRNEKDPVWAPDGREVLFRAPDGLFRRALDSPHRRPLLLQTDAIPEDWSADGRFVLYVHCRPACSQVWALPMPSGQDPRLVAESSGSVDEARLSPDNRWLAYASDEAGRWDVYLQPFPEPGVRRRVSLDGGSQPRWRRDGAELVYLALDGTFMSIPMRSDGKATLPAALFKVPLEVNPVADQYAMTPDAKRFLVIIPNAMQTQRLEVLTHWRAAIGEGGLAQSDAVADPH